MEPKYADAFDGIVRRNIVIKPTMDMKELAKVFGFHMGETPDDLPE